MPILPREPFVYPGDLFEGESNLAKTSSWWALHSRPRSEKALARILLGLGLPHFLPLCQKFSRTRRGREFTAYVPMFPGYLFLCGDEQTKMRALATKKVARCLPVPDPVELYDDLLGVYRLMLSDLPVTPEQIMPPGTQVEIVNGSLRGLRGKVVRKEKRLRFIVEVHFLHQGACIEIDGSMLEKLPA